MWSLGHTLAHPGRHRPEVLAHDDAARPVRFERDHRVELVRSIRHVRPLPGVESLGDPVEALQAHHVIDPQVGGVPEQARRTISMK